MLNFFAEKMSVAFAVPFAVQKRYAFNHISFIPSDASK